MWQDGNIQVFNLRYTMRLDELIHLHLALYQSSSGCMEAILSQWIDVREGS